MRWPRCSQRAAGAAQAADCAFRPNAPDQHLVVRGDTLWDISGKFLEHPWCWPQVWGMNRDEIANPHWIYPGQIVYFDRANGRLSPDPPGSGGGSEACRTIRLSPQVRTEGLGARRHRGHPVRRHRTFPDPAPDRRGKELAGAPRIAANAGRPCLPRQGRQILCARRPEWRQQFQVFRPGTPLRDPDTNKIIAYEAVYLGSVALQTAAAPGRRRAHLHRRPTRGRKWASATGWWRRRRRRCAIMCRIRRRGPSDARVLGIYSGVTFAGQNQVISVNRGTVDGLDVGAVLRLTISVKTVADPGGSKGFMGIGKSKVKLPDEQVGSLFIFRVFKHVSYGLIMQTTQPVQVGDVAASPE